MKNAIPLFYMKNLGITENTKFRSRSFMSAPHNFNDYFMILI